MPTTHQCPTSRPCNQCTLHQQTGLLWDGSGLVTLHLWCAVPKLYCRALDHFAAVGQPVTGTAQDRNFRITLAPDELVEAVRSLTGVLSHDELLEVLVLVRPEGVEPCVEDIAELITLERLLKAVRSQWLSSLFLDGRYTTHFQPIVDVHDTSRVFGHEALFRGLDEGGAIVPPYKIFELARLSNLLFQADLHAVRSAVREATGHGLRKHVFINFNPTSFIHPENCLAAALELIDGAGLPRDRVVFEVVESEHVGDVPGLVKVIDAYRELGFKVALDDLGSGYSSLNLVHALRPDFIKLDMALVRDVDHHLYKATVTQKLLELAGDLNVESIAEGVETESELVWLREHGARYVQGYLIARPASPPVLATPRI